MTCYRITFRDSRNKEQSLPVVSENAVKAVSDLILLGYDLQKVTHSFPSV